jgi:asparagine synthase (glutamine-hydrolysing)
MTTYLPDDLLVKADRMTMAASLEARSPLLDTDLIDYVATLPATFKATPRRSKRLLRAAAQGLLPPEIIGRRKHGFGVPVGAWFRGELAEPFQDLVLAPNARTGSVLNRAGVQGLFDAHRSGSAEHGHRLWSLFALESFLRSATP